MANARAHTLIRKYTDDVLSATPTALKRLLDWKMNRGGEEVRERRRRAAEVKGHQSWLSVCAGLDHTGLNKQEVEP